MVEKSINQVKSECLKALVGINLSYSLADDCSNLCCNLAKLKIPFLKDLIKVLKKYEIQKIDDEAQSKDKFKYLVAPLYSLNLIEYLASKNEKWFGHVTAPNYLISAMLIYNFENQKNFMLLNKENNLVFCVKDKTMYLNKKKLTDNFYFIETKLDLSVINKFKFDKILNFDRYIVKTSEWNELLKFSKKTYVKESKTSKEKGAGY